MKTSLSIGLSAVLLASAIAPTQVHGAKLPPSPPTACTSNNLGDQQETLTLLGDGTGYYTTYRCVFGAQGYYWELLGFAPCIVGPRGCIKI